MIRARRCLFGTAEVRHVKTIGLFGREVETAMKLFKCQHCEQLLYFENTACERCGYRLGFLPEIMTLSAVKPEGDVWRALAVNKKTFRFCANAEFGVCNWMVEASAAEQYCTACRHNRTI